MFPKKFKLFVIFASVLLITLSSFLALHIKGNDITIFNFLIGAIIMPSIIGYILSEYVFTIDKKFRKIISYVFIMFYFYGYQWSDVFMGSFIHET